MSVNIGGNGGGLKKLLGIVGSIYSGGSTGAAAGIGSTAGEIAGGAAAANPDSQLGKAAGIYGTAKNIGQMTNTSNNGDSMSRALQAQQQSPDYLVHNALQTLKDPNVANSMPFDVYMKSVEPLLRYKHFGGGDGEGQTQGTIDSSQSSDNSGGLGAITSLIAIL